MVLFTAVWIFWYKSASHHLLKITVTSLLLNLVDHTKLEKNASEHAYCQNRPTYNFETARNLI